jgi:hypothetical protein
MNHNDDIAVNRIPELGKAEEMLKEAEQLNPGPWVKHSLYVAQGAKLIAANCQGMDSEAAYIVGMLHDIGRRFGVTNMRHSIDGYNYLIKDGYDFAGRICLTHSHPNRNIEEAFGKWDCSHDDYKFVENFLSTTVYNDYDKLIQLCDAIALPSGFTLMEKRMVDVALRHGFHEYIIPKWKETFEIKKYFENKMGKSIYNILPGVVENTFE